MSIEQESPKTQCSQLIAQSNINYDDSVSFYESQIRKADSLYKNYLPQYNFDEVKAAMEFFDSIRNSGVQELRNSGVQEFRGSGFRLKVFGFTDRQYIGVVLLK